MSDEEILHIDDPAVLELLPRYLERRVEDIQTMRDDLAREAFDPVAHLAHRMRGSGAAYGVPFVTQIGKQIEHAARQLDAAAIADGLDRLAAYLPRIRIA